MSSRVMSRSHSRLPSDDEVLEEDDLANLSFTSHISSMGRAQGAAADLESIATAAAAAQQRGTNADAAVPAQEVPVETIDTFSVKDTVKKFMVTGYPLTGSTLSQFSLGTVIISVVGKCLGVEELGGASLALGLVNATGFAFGAGLCGALETVLSHTYGKFARGEEDEAVDKEENLASLKMYGIYAQRMAAILFIVAFPLGIILCFADALLSAVGEDEQVVRYTGIWCRMAVFGVPATLAYQLVQRYYSCQHLTKPLSIAMITAALVNPLLQLLFVKMFGFHGSPIAWLLLMTCITGGLIWHMQRSGLAKKTWSGWDERSLRNIGSLARIAIPSMGVMLSEWVALEINALAAGFATPNELAAFSITAQLFGIMWGIGSGCIILTCVFVGNAIGAGQPLVARSIAFTAIGLVFIISLIDVIVFYIFGDYIPYLFTNDDEVAQIYKSLMNIVLPYHLMDTFQSTVMAILRGCELQKLGAVIITTAFCAVGVPLSFLLFFHFDIGVRALWIGPFVGVSVVGFPLYVYILLRYIDWSQLKPHKDGDHVEEVDRRQLKEVQR